MEETLREDERCEALKTAKNCRHYAMCKVDYLSSGVCASGLKKQYASFYPVGRMDLYAALIENAIPVTEKCIEIADDCNLCGQCDYQCYFVNELRPIKVMRALKEYVDAYRKSGGDVVCMKDDEILAGLKEIVGDFWATSDPAIRVAYDHDLCPHVDFKMPQYVVMPGSKEQVAAVIKFLNRYGIAYTVRGNGASSHGLVFTEGAVLDLHRMNAINFDESKWGVSVGPGVAGFELQTAAQRRGYRVNTAEPAALVCANLMTSGLLSTFSTTYGVSADNFIDAEFVSRDGSLFSLNDIGAPNLFSFQNSQCEHDALAICVSVRIKLHPVTEDEEGILVPFHSFEEALAFSRECAIRHIGLAIGMLGSDFVSTFLAPTKKLAAQTKDVFVNKLDMPYLVLLIADAYALKSIRRMGHPFIDQKLFRTLYQGLPSLSSAGWLDLLSGFSEDEPYSYLQSGQFGKLAAMALTPSPSQMAQEMEPELRPFFEKLFLRPEMTDLVWLNTFRVQSARYCRENPCVALVCYVPMDPSLIAEIQGKLREIADGHRLRSGFGFITPIDQGKRCIWEYDIYFDHNSPDEIARIRLATHEAGALLDAYCEKTGTIRQLRYAANRGCCRKENLLYQ